MLLNLLVFDMWKSSLLGDTGALNTATGEQEGAPTSLSQESAPSGSQMSALTYVSVPNAITLSSPSL